MSEFLMVSEAARALGWSEPKVRAWTDSGKLPCLRTDTGRRLIRRADVERVKAEACPAATPSA
jgi:excisionase family DNA binding protein